MISTERWATIPSNRNYAVSDQGRVKVISTREILKSWDRKGKQQVRLGDAVTGKCHYIHCLVSKAFPGVRL